MDKEIVIKVKELASQYEKRIFRAKDNRMKLEELITSLAYLDYRMRQPYTEIIKVLNIYKRNDRMCARIMSKDNVTKILSELSNKNPEIFVESLRNVEEFINKILILINNDGSRMRELFSHSRKGTQCKTDQNYYFLWAMLFEINISKVKAEQEKVLRYIVKLFSIIQKTPSDYSVDDFLKMLDNAKKI